MHCGFEAICGVGAAACQGTMLCNGGDSAGARMVRYKHNKLAVRSTPQVAVLVGNIYCREVVHFGWDLAIGRAKGANLRPMLALQCCLATS